jgi:DNA (cytosine-5)-methyltransferase 1
VEELEANELERYYRKNGIKLLAGCAPCQTFSTYNLKARYSDEKDKRWFLPLEFARLVNEISPELVAMENVPGLAGQDVFAKFIKTLQDNGYNVAYQVVACQEYGIPQNRRRLVLLASKLGMIRLLTPDEFGAEKKNVGDVLRTLPPLRAGEKSKDDPLHQCSMLSPLNLQRIRASKPGEVGEIASRISC